MNLIHEQNLPRGSATEKTVPLATFLMAFIKRLEEMGPMVMFDIGGACNHAACKALVDAAVILTTAGVPTTIDIIDEARRVCGAQTDDEGGPRLHSIADGEREIMPEGLDFFDPEDEVVAHVRKHYEADQVTPQDEVDAFLRRIDEEDAS